MAVGLDLPALDNQVCLGARRVDKNHWETPSELALFLRTASNSERGPPLVWAVLPHGLECGEVSFFNAPANPPPDLITPLS